MIGASMEFGWEEEHEKFRGRVRDAINRLLPADWDETYVRESYASDLQIDFSREFCSKLAQEGLLTPHWPKQYGGDEAEDWQHFILNEEMKAAGEPRGPQYMNVNWIGPALMKYGTDEQKHVHLNGISSGRVVWCQGFSEPNAGTDLAALRTRAVRDGDDYVINGSKIWTSYARRADWCFLLAKTGLNKKDVSVFLLPMDCDGIEVTSYNGIPKFGHLNEVYFADVRVRSENRLGDENKAWEIVTYALSYERVGVPRYHTGLEALDLAVSKLKSDGRFNDPGVRAHASRIAAQFEAARMLTYLVVDQRVKKEDSNGDANGARIISLKAVNDLMSFIVEYFPETLADGDLLLDDYYRVNAPAGITGGANEIQLDLVAQRLLGLPRG